MATTSSLAAEGVRGDWSIVKYRSGLSVVPLRKIRESRWVVWYRPSDEIDRAADAGESGTGVS